MAKLNRAIGPKVTATVVEQEAYYTGTPKFASYDIVEGANSLQCLHGEPGAQRYRVTVTVTYQLIEDNEHV